MFAFRIAWGWGLLFLAITPAFAQSVNNTPSQLGPFREVLVASFADVWQEPVAWTAAEDEFTSAEGESAVPLSVTNTPQQMPILTVPPMTPLPTMRSTTDSIRAAQSGLFEWLFKMLGIVGLVALAGVYWVFRIRPVLDDRHTTSRLQLSSALPLPRRPGLFLIDVENQSVLVAMDGGGIRQVIPLGLLPSMKTTGRRAAADKAPRATSPSTSPAAPAWAEMSFPEVYQQQRGRGGEVLAVLPVAKSATRSKESSVPVHPLT